MVNLSDLVLIRNDPDVVEAFMEAATEGDVDAQYGLGIIYAEGRGVPQDEVRSFYWLTLAMEQGDMDAKVLRQVVAINMSDEQYMRAQMLLKEQATQH